MASEGTTAPTDALPPQDSGSGELRGAEETGRVRKAIYRLMLHTYAQVLRGVMKAREDSLARIVQSRS